MNDWIDLKTHLTDKDGWKAAGLSDLENFGNDPCRMANLIASNTPNCNKNKI